MCGGGNTDSCEGVARLSFFLAWFGVGGSGQFWGRRPLPPPKKKYGLQETLKVLYYHEHAHKSSYSDYHNHMHTTQQSQDTEHISSLKVTLKKNKGNAE